MRLVLSLEYHLFLGPESKTFGLKKEAFHKALSPPFCDSIELNHPTDIGRQFGDLNTSHWCWVFFRIFHTYNLQVGKNVNFCDSSPSSQHFFHPPHLNSLQSQLHLVWLSIFHLYIFRKLVSNSQAASPRHVYVATPAFQKRTAKTLLVFPTSLSPEFDNKRFIVLFQLGNNESGMKICSCNILELQDVISLCIIFFLPCC